MNVDQRLYGYLLYIATRKFYDMANRNFQNIYLLCLDTIPDSIFVFLAMLI